MSLEITTLDIDADGPEPQGPWPAPLGPWFADARRHYILLDAARLEDLTGEENVPVFAAGLRCKSLFRDGDLDAVAPWLIELVADDPDSDEVLGMFFGDLFGKRAGVLLRSAAPFDRLYSHLRTFVMVRHERRETDLFFRYWDPLVASTYFPGIADRTDRTERLLWTADGDAVDLLAEEDEVSAHLMTPGGTAPERAARSTLVLNSDDAALLNEVAFKALALQLNDWMAGAFPDGVGTLPRPARRAAARHVVDTGRAFGFRLKDEFSYLAHVMAHFGGWFFEGDGTPDLARIVLDHDDPARHKSLEAAFGPAWDASPRGALLARWDVVHAQLGALTPTARIEPDTLKSLVRDVLGDRVGMVQAVRDKVLPVARENALSVNGEGQHLFLSLLLGHRYQDDPFRPWAGAPLVDAMEQAWQSVFGQ
ncbi:MAG: DUF4123 domain-containing protein [Pseudomonadota bacterium]